MDSAEYDDIVRRVTAMEGKFGKPDGLGAAPLAELQELCRRQREIQARLDALLRRLPETP